MPLLERVASGATEPAEDLVGVRRLRSLLGGGQVRERERHACADCLRALDTAFFELVGQYSFEYDTQLLGAQPVRREARRLERESQGAARREPVEGRVLFEAISGEVE